MTIVSPYFIFPSICWWVQATKTDIVIFDTGEHFQKMTSRNRYDISGANNPIKLSVPLVNGRNQHIPMAEVQIYNGDRWQTQHWRTLVSVYKRSPYFDHYEHSLKPLFETPFTQLVDFNRASLLWVKLQLRMEFEIQETNVYVRDYPTEVIDLRSSKRDMTDSTKYYQVFEDRIGFQPDLSILDLLFSEGTFAIERLGA